MQSITLFPRAEFESLVAQALDELPPYFQAKMSNVEVVIELWPTRDDLYLAGVPAGQTLLGLYHGVPLTQRGAHYQSGAARSDHHLSRADRAGLSHARRHPRRSAAYGDPQDCTLSSKESTRRQTIRRFLRFIPNTRARRQIPA